MFFISSNLINVFANARCLLSIKPYTVTKEKENYMETKGKLEAYATQ